MKDDLQKSDSCGLKSERKKILTSSTCSLACLSTNLGAFCPMVVHLPSEKLILPYFSIPRGVAILDCDSHSQAGSTRLPTKIKQKSLFAHLLDLYCQPLKRVTRSLISESCFKGGILTNKKVQLFVILAGGWGLDREDQKINSCVFLETI